MKTSYKMVAAGLIVVAIVGLLTWLFPGERGPGLAFADVVERLEAVRSGKFTMTLEGHPEQTAQAVFLNPGRMRFDHAEGAISFLIVNDVLHKQISVYRNKRVVIVHTKGLEPVDRYPERYIRGFREGLFRQEEEIELLGEQEIEGRAAVGYRFGDESSAQIVWADRGTGLPVLEQLIRAGAPTVTLSEFEWNVDVDESLFDFTPPPDYEVIEKELDYTPALDYTP